MHHAYDKHDPYFVYHCRMIAWIIANEKNLSYEAYHRAALSLGIAHMSESWYNMEMGITPDLTVGEVTL